jgi:hypothetical protein
VDGPSTVPYEIGDKVVVRRRGRFGFFWWGPFPIPRRGLAVSDPRSTGKIVEVIRPSEDRGIRNAGGYKVEFEDGRTHYYRGEDLRSAAGPPQT